MISDKLQTIIKDHPEFHRGETEVDRSFERSESLLSTKTVEKIFKNELTSYGIENEVLLFIADNIHKDSKTLETGAGSSTLVFALGGSDHTAITPSQNEIKLIREYAANNGISMEKINFIQESSDSFLPGSKAEGFDLILLDGKHAFPWPVIDWFYTADKLKRDGLMIIDDAEMKSVSILIDFMKVDTGWEMIKDFSGKTFVFKKLRASIHDVAWHMQPYTIISPMNRVTNRIKKFIKSNNTI